MLNEVGITNSGFGAVDAGSVIITEAIAANTALRVTDFDGSTPGPIRFADGSPDSNLSYTFTSLADPSDDVAFSNNNGATYTYTPVPDANGIDVNVTNIRITPQNTLQGDTGSGPPTATFEFKTVVQ
jgi:hypothetical protein